MMTRNDIAALCYTLIASAAIAATVVTYQQKHPARHDNEQTTENEYTTNKHIVFSDENPVADPALVGTWLNTDNPRWHKTYLDDYDGDGFFWGKEWDEAQDVFEEDLVYHGNGWFRWRIEGHRLTEVSTMDMRDVAIPKQWKMQIYADNDSLTLADVIPPHNMHKFFRAKPY